MKIQTVNAQALQAENTQSTALTDSTAGAGELFRRTLSTLDGQAREEHLMGLIKQIDEQGKRLAEKCDVSEFIRYRAAVKNFLDDIVSNGYEFNKESTFASRGRHRFLVTVTTVNDKLDALAKEVLSEQSDNLKIVHAVDDIRGLLVDIFS